MKNIIVLPLYMSLSGTLAFFIYFCGCAVFGKRIRAGARYRMMKMCLMFYLLPFPYIKYWILRYRIYWNGSGIDTGVFYTADTVFQSGGQLLMQPLQGNMRKTILLVFALVLGILLWKIKQYLIFRRSVMIHGRQMASDAELEKLIVRSGISRKVTILKCDEEISPFTVGVFRPVIMMTKIIEKQEEELALLHEMQHIRNRDFLVRSLSLLCLIFHFWNPIVYLFWKEMQEVQEFACDEKVLNHISEERAKEYGDLIIRVSARCKENKEPAIGLSWSNRKFLKKRIYGIVHPVRNRSLMTAIICGVMFLSAGIPVAAYNPKTAYMGAGGGITEDEINNPDIDWIEFEIGEPELYPEDEQNFAYMDTYFISDEGKIMQMNELSVEAGEDLSSVQALCSHNYVSGTKKRHFLNATTGGCTVKIYRCELCTKCGKTKNMKLTNTNIYNPCPHK